MDPTQQESNLSLGAREMEETAGLPVSTRVEQLHALSLSFTFPGSQLAPSAVQPYFLGHPLVTAPFVPDNPYSYRPNSSILQDHTHSVHISASPERISERFAHGEAIYNVVPLCLESSTPQCPWCGTARGLVRPSANIHNPKLLHVPIFHQIYQLSSCWNS